MCPYTLSPPLAFPTPLAYTPAMTPPGDTARHLALALDAFIAGVVWDHDLRRFSRAAKNVSDSARDNISSEKKPIRVRALQSVHL